MVSGSLSMVSKSGSVFKVDIDSAVISVCGHAIVNNRQNKPEFEEIIKKIVPIKFINIAEMVVAKNKTL